jgi:hypothetical protein
MQRSNSSNSSCTRATPGPALLFFLSQHSVQSLPRSKRIHEPQLNSTFTIEKSGSDRLLTCVDVGYTTNSA